MECGGSQSLSVYIKDDMTTEIVRFADSVTGADVELSVDKIKEGLCPMATNQEAVMFLELCRHMGLNPWVKDAYLIKYDDKRPATMVVGKDAFTKRADSNPHFAGIESGVIVQMGDKLEYRKGTLVLKGEVIVGGWAKVARSDRKIDMDTTVTFDEYNTKRGVWNNMPAVMIEKCAIVKALRSAFPATFSGMYDTAEMREIQMDEQGEILLDAKGPVVVEDAPRPVPQVKNIDPNKPTHKDQPAPECYDCQDDAEQAALSAQERDAANGESTVAVNRTDLLAAADQMQAEAEAIKMAAEVVMVEEDEVRPTCQGSVLEYEEPTPCVKDGHGDGIYTVHENDATGARRWAHQYPYQLNGKRVWGWCIYEGDIPVPSAA